MNNLSENFDWKDRLLFCEHHLSHWASAFYPSPFEGAVVLTMDGVGEWATTSATIGDGHPWRCFTSSTSPTLSACSVRR